jgi:hypothetical protein
MDGNTDLHSCKASEDLVCEIRVIICTEYEHRFAFPSTGTLKSMPDRI